MFFNRRLVVVLGFLVAAGMLLVFNAASSAQASNQVLRIAIKSIEIVQVEDRILDEDDLETKWAMIVPFADTLTTEIEYPGNSFIPARVGDTIEVNERMNWSEKLNTRNSDEYIFYVVGVDIDDPSLEDFNTYGRTANSYVSIADVSSIFSSVIGAGLNALGSSTGSLNTSSVSRVDWKKIAISTAHGIELKAPDFIRRSSQYLADAASPILSFAVSPLGGAVVGVALEEGLETAVDYFRQNDEIDTAAIILKRSEDWNTGLHTIESSTGAFVVTYEVTLLTQALLEVTNNTGQNICSLRVIPESEFDETQDYSPTDNEQESDLENILTPNSSLAYAVTRLGQEAQIIIAYDCYGRELGRIWAEETQSEVSITNQDIYPENYLEIVNQTERDICFLVLAEYDETDKLQPIDELLGYTSMSAGNRLVLLHSEIQGSHLVALDCEFGLIAGFDLQEIDPAVSGIWSIALPGDTLRERMGVVNLTDESICQLSLDGRELLENSFQPIQIEAGQQYFVNIVPGVYAFKAATCDTGRSWSGDVDLDGTEVFDLELDE
ncbi:MAG: hypothetical protein KC441_13340 [Anaerolineales bacterium]|nr:hypothetical protein [Anaerolineales bacterium]